MDTAAQSDSDNVEDVPRRKPGRPRGAQNKISRDAKALLALRGQPAIRALCKLAAGSPIFRRTADGKRERLEPNLDQIISAQKLVLDRLVPSLRAVEQSGGLANSNDITVTAPEPTNMQLANALLNVLHAGRDSQPPTDTPSPVSAIRQPPSSENAPTPVPESLPSLQDSLAALQAAHAPPSEPDADPEPSDYWGKRQWRKRHPETSTTERGHLEFLKSVNGAAMGRRNR